uniref:hypothetical protein n=1 Tax=Jatropha curcas TaxID=180498 RepID=UPI0027A697B0|nr:hypothetical protein QLP06_mgp056 [Jatropha curcas]WFG81183.1 hypothetical protein [Jatropha curcas]
MEDLPNLDAAFIQLRLIFPLCHLSLLLLIHFLLQQPTFLQNSRVHLHLIKGNCPVFTSIISSNRIARFRLERRPSCARARHLMHVRVREGSLFGTYEYQSG